MDAALRRFAVQGYDGTSVRQIAEDVGIRDSALYAHFDSKCDLLEALVEQYGASLIDNLGMSIANISEHPPQEILPALFDKLLTKWDEERSRLFMGLVVRERIQNVPEVLAGVRQRFVPHFEHWLRSGQMKPVASPSMLVWELTLPVASVRILYLNAHATPALRQEGIRMAREHVRYFIETVTPS